jgi:hypothetical protein
MNKRKTALIRKQLVPLSVNQTALVIEASQASPTIFFSAFSSNLHLAAVIKC